MAVTSGASNCKQGDRALIWCALERELRFSYDGCSARINAQPAAVRSIAPALQPILTLLSMQGTRVNDLEQP